MILERLEHFHHPQSLIQRNDENWLLIHFSGLDYANSEMPSGEDLGPIEYWRPFALFLPSKGKFSFSYGDRRDNWVLMLSDHSIEEKSCSEVDLRMNGSQISIPAYHSLSTHQVERAQSSLKRLLLAFHRPGANRDVLVSLSLNALLDIILNPDSGPERADPVEAFRQSIVEDRNFTKTLATLSDEIGYSSDHLRRLFEQSYGISPKIFREQYRMDLAMNFLNSGMTAKTVSKELGYHYPAHFSNAFKKFYGTSPSSRNRLDT